MQKTLRELRQEKRLKGVEVARDLKLQPSRLSLIEGQFIIPGKDQQKLLADYYGVSIDDIDWQ